MNYIEQASQTSRVAHPANTVFDVFFEVDTINHNHDVSIRVTADSEEDAVVNAINVESGAFEDDESTLSALKNKGLIEDEDAGKKWVLQKIIPLRAAMLDCAPGEKERYVMVPLAGNYDAIYTKKYYA